MGIRCQFVDKLWTFHNFLLCFLHFPGRHTGEAILAKIKEALTEVGVEESQVINSRLCAYLIWHRVAMLLSMLEIFG